MKQDQQGAPLPAATILYLVDGLGLSGKTKSLVELITHLDPARYRAVVCSFTEEKTALAERLEELGIAVQTVPCPNGLHFSMALRLADLMRRFRPAVVHCYNPRPIIYGGLAAWYAGIPARIGSLSAFACQVPDRDYVYLPQRLHTVSRRNVYRNRFAARLMKCLVTVSAALGERFFRFNGLPLNRLEVIPYGVDMDQFVQHSAEEVVAFRRHAGLKPEHFVIGSVGRLVEEKDYPSQFRAFAIARKVRPHLRMLLAGDGPLREQLETLARELDIHESVRFIGHCDRVALVMQSLDLFVLASKFETFGVVLLEAKAASLPIVATRIQEVPAILADRESGWLVPPSDSSALAAAFLALTDNVSLRKQLGARARFEAQERHSLQAVTQRYQSLYDRTRIAQQEYR